MTLTGNPFNCEWLMREVIELKNVKLGRNYVAESRQNILKVEGIQCFEDDEANERRLIVVESKAKVEVEDEVSHPYQWFRGILSWVTVQLFSQISFNQGWRVCGKSSRLEDGDWNQWLWLQVSFALVVLRFSRCFHSSSSSQMSPQQVWKAKWSIPTLKAPGLLGWWWNQKLLLPQMKESYQLTHEDKRINTRLTWSNISLFIQYKVSALTDVSTEIDLRVFLLSYFKFLLSSHSIASLLFFTFNLAKNRNFPFD